MKKLTQLAKTDKALDGAFGLFTPHQAGAKRNPVNIEIKANGMITSFYAKESLCDIDLRTLQTICALAYSATKSANTGHLVTTMHQVLLNAGLNNTSVCSIKSIKKSLGRLAATLWEFQSASELEGTKDECYGGGSLIQYSFEHSETKTGALTINIHPRLFKVITGDITRFNNLQMNEVRKLKTGVQRVLHHYLCSLLWAGQEPQPLTIDKLIERVWNQPPCQLKQTHYINRRNQITKALNFIAANTGGAWSIQELSGDRYIVTRADIVEQ